ncbi:Histone deacetylase complex subunit CTI6 [Apiospora phragmitis]|uniref:Histone deacetylase complex subunit CTI6 n=1 Tax=Apiospora phragmitis TaxID=2905665 RepID=A0ABR1UR24_9PEZI
MAGTSPTRRSSRARTTQPQSQHSSSASSASGRAERTTRAFTKNGSPQKSTGSGSLSSEPPEDSTATTASTDDIAPLLRRRSTRVKDEDREKQPKSEHIDMANISDDNEIQEDDEAVRCVCGFEDYPGPPPLDEDTKSHALKDSIDLEPIFSIDITEDLGGFFVQCDTCKVWEHGLCVGIVTEESSPDNYYCEQCRRDLHKIYTASNGRGGATVRLKRIECRRARRPPTTPISPLRSNANWGPCLLLRNANIMAPRSQKYSIYLPIHRPSRSTSRAASAATHGTRSPKGSERKSSRASASAAAAAAHHKRRSTMNSRDAAYDEEEQLRRAIEASKEDAIPEELEGAGRRPKRGRDDEEPSESIIKRQRTNSKSPSPSADQAPMESREESEDESSTRNGVLKKSSRNNVRSQREKTERDERREEQERKRVEAANKRKGRAERRRADGMTAATTTAVAKLHNTDMDVNLDSDPSDEMPSSTRAAVSRTTESVQPPDPPVSSQPAPDTPPANPPPSASHKRKAAPQQRKKGRNQYTKDRDAHEHEDSPARSMSRDIARNQDDHHVAHTKPSVHESHNRHSNSKAKGGMSSKITMSDLKRRANNILEFISRTRVELANEPLSEKNSSHQAATDDGSATDMPSIQVNGTQSSDEKDCRDITVTKPPALTGPTKDFKDMSCVEMMDSLTRDLVKWQKEFAS